MTALPGTRTQNQDIDPKMISNASTEDAVFGDSHWEFQTSLLSIDNHPNLYFALPPNLNAKNTKKKNDFYKGINHYKDNCRMHDIYELAQEDLQHIHSKIVELLNATNTYKDCLFPIEQELNGYFQTALLLLACGFIKPESLDIYLFVVFMFLFFFVVFIYKEWFLIFLFTKNGVFLSFYFFMFLFFLMFLFTKNGF